MRIIKRLLLACVLCVVVSFCILYSYAGEHTHTFTSNIISDATCKESGRALYSCACGESYYEDIAPLGHSLTSNKCSRCNKFVIDVGERLTLTATTPSWSLDWGWQTNSSILKYDTWSIDVSSNCYYTAYFTGIKEGETSVYFIYNNYYYSSCVVSVEHRTHSYGDYVSNGDATCEDGTKTAKCLYCDAVSTVVDEGSAKHNFADYSSDNNASCTADGTKTRKCLSCSKQETVVDIDSMLPHTYIINSETLSTCTTKGVIKYACVCGESYTTEQEALGHNIVEESRQEPTCNNDGIVNSVCTKCDFVKQESIPATNHTNAIIDNGIPATCTQTGFTAGKYCPDCDTWLEGHETIPTTAHSYISEVAAEPTCFKEGVITYTCTCGDSYTETIAKKDHEYATWQIKTNPTCMKPGSEWSYCLNCDNDFEREIPATGHKVIEYVMKASTDEMAAYGGNGAYMTACEICNEVFKQDFFARPAEYKLSTSAFIYNGSVRKPSIIVKDADGKTLIEGQDYDVIYSNGMKLPGKYEVKVLFKGNYLGEKNLTYIIKPKAVTNLKAKSQTTTAITLGFTKSAGVTGYQIDRYNSKTEKYVRVSDTAKNSITAKNLTAGSKYKFRVRAYVEVDGEYIYSSYVYLNTATKTAKPTIKSATLSNRKVTLKWDNISGENGYQIYYSTSKNGTYKKLTTVGANKTKFTSDKLTMGKTYYFKVRAYKTVGDTTVYSAFSNIKNTKIK